MNIQFITHIDVTWLAASVLHKDREALWHGDSGRPGPDANMIYLRGPAGLTSENLEKDEPCENYKALEDWPAAKKAMDRIHKALPATQLKVRGHAFILEIFPNGGTPWYVDDTDYAKAHVRFMVPLVTNPCVFMSSGPHCSHVEVGSLVMVNHRALCSIVNFNTVHRCINLVVDYRATE